MRRRKGYFVRKGTAILLSAVLMTGLVVETGLVPVGKVYAEEETVDQPTDVETPSQGEEQPEEPTNPDTPSREEEEPEEPENPETPSQGEEQPEEESEDPETPAQSEEQPEEDVDSETPLQEEAADSVSENTLESVMPVSLEAKAREMHSHDGIDYTAWESNDSLPDQAGNYYLTENVNLAAKWEVPAGTVNLCLNGKTITQTAAADERQPVLYIKDNVFNLYDCGSGGKITGGQDSGVQMVSARMNLYGGEISGNCVQIHAEGRYIGDFPGGGISLTSQSVLHMYGGRIADNSGYAGGGVCINSKSEFVMEQGEVTGNQSHYGGGIHVGDSSSITNRCTFIMNGGRIAGNHTEWEKFSGGPDDFGGGVSVYGSFTMYGGEIRENTCHAFGGGVGVAGYGEFVMNDGKINNNICHMEEKKSGAGGGVYALVDHGNGFTMNGGEITGNRAYHGGGVYADVLRNKVAAMYVGGNAKVSGNQDMEGSASNVLMMMRESPIQKIVVNESSPLTDGAFIGIHMGKVMNREFVVIAGDVTGENSADYSRFFHSDSEEFEVVNSDSGNIIQLVEVTSHNWATEWSSDAANHWHACLDAGCSGKKDVAAHTEDSGTRTKEPTETEKGTITYRCTVCGYEMRTEEIPETGGEQGGAALEVDKVPGAPDISFVISSKEELAKLITPLLTEEEKAQVEAGADVKLILKVQDAQNSASDADKAVVTEALNGFTVGQYLDITLKKAVGTTETPVTETGEKIKLTIRVPESLRNIDANKTRTFAVIRVHGGTAAVLNDLDENADTITIETNRFSTYALVYHDTANGGGSGDGGNGDSGNNSGNSGSSGGSGSGSSSNSGNGGGSSSGSDSSGSGSGSGGSDSGNIDNSNAAADNSSVVSMRAEAGGSGDSGNNGGSGSSGSGSGNGGNTNNAVNSGGTSSTSGGKEPKTGDDSLMKLFATGAMIAGFIYLLLYFEDRAKGMTEREKDAFVAAFIRWAKKGGIFRKICAFSAIFVLLAYYHSIGKRTATGLGEVYGA